MLRTHESETGPNPSARGAVARSKTERAQSALTISGTRSLGLLDLVECARFVARGLSSELARRSSSLERSLIPPMNEAVQEGIFPRDSLLPVSGKKSKTWVHFRLHPCIESKVVCFHCYPESGVASRAQAYASTTSSSVLLRHLENKHRDFLDERPAKRQKKIDAHFSSSVSKELKEQADFKLMLWMVLPLPTPSTFS